MNKNTLRSIAPPLVIFVLVTVFCLFGKNWLEKKGVNKDVVLVANGILFIVSLAAFWIAGRSLRSSNPRAFVRAIYGSFLVKFFTLLVAAFIYIMTAQKDVNIPALVIGGALYIVYTFLEIRALNRLLKQQKKNA